MSQTAGIQDAGDTLPARRKGDEANSKGQYRYADKHMVLAKLEPSDVFSLEIAKKGDVSPFIASLLRRLWRAIPSMGSAVPLSSLDKSLGSIDVDNLLEHYNNMVIDVNTALISASRAASKLRFDSVVEADVNRYAAITILEHAKKSIAQSYADLFANMNGTHLHPLKAPMLRCRNSTTYSLNPVIFGRPSAWVLDDDRLSLAWKDIIPQRGSGAERKKGFERPELSVFESEYTGSIALPDIKDEEWPDLILNTFGLKGVEFGNWNKQSERLEFMKQSFIGLKELARVLGIPDEQIGMKRRLGLAIGARGRGKANASFQGIHSKSEGPVGIINLTRRRGPGSLAHEYGHALDFFAYADAKYNVNKHTGFLSETVTKGQSATGSKEGMDILEDVVRGKIIRMVEEDFLLKRSELEGEFEAYIPKAKIEIMRSIENIRESLKLISKAGGMDHEFAIETWRMLCLIAKTCKESGWGDATDIIKAFMSKDLPVLDKPCRHVDVRHELYLIFDNLRYRATLDRRMDRLLAQSESYTLNKKDFTPFGLSRNDGFSYHTDMMKSAIKLDGKSDYLEGESEMWARSFEAWVHDRMADTGLKHSFLVNGVMQEDYRIEPGNEHALRSLFPYPSGKDRVILNKVIDVLCCGDPESAIMMTGTGTDMKVETTEGPAI